MVNEHEDELLRCFDTLHSLAEVCSSPASLRSLTGARITRAQTAVDDNLRSNLLSGLPETIRVKSKLTMAQPPQNFENLFSALNNFSEAIASGIQIPKFDGKNPDTVDSFFQSFENACAYYNWPDEKRKIALGNALTETALDYFMMLKLAPDFVNQSYDGLKKKIQSFFHTVSNPSKIEDIIRNTKQHIFESPYNYVIRKSKLVRNYLPNVTEQQLVLYAVQGLSSSLLEKLADRKIQTLSQLLAELQTLHQKQFSVAEGRQDELAEWYQYQHNSAYPFQAFSQPLQPMQNPGPFPPNFQPSFKTHFTPSAGFENPFRSDMSSIPSPNQSFNPMAPSFQPSAPTSSDWYPQINKAQTTVQNSKENSPDKQQQTSIRAESGARSTSDVDKLCAKMSDLVLKLESTSFKGQSNTNSFKGSRKFNSRSRNSNSLPPRTQNDSRIVCYSCGGYNHTRRFCLANKTSTTDTTTNSSERQSKN